MKISVITVCRNSAQTIRHTLDSFLEQDWPDRELVVVDGASSDNTVAIVRSYASPDITVLSEPDKGMYDALNKGLELYRGDAFGVLNADDAFHDAAVLSRVALALENAHMAHGDLDFVQNHESGSVVRRWRARPRPRSGFRSGWMPAHPTFYVRREVQRAVGKFDLGYRTASDYDWMLRAIDIGGFSLATINHVMVDMMIGGRSTTGLSAHLVHNYEALCSRRRWLGSGVVDFALLAKPAGKLGQYLDRTSQSARNK